MGEKKRILFIINPKSGVQSKRNFPHLVSRYIDHERYDVSTEYTSYAGHASEIAASAVNEGYYAIVAVGGDGTINEVAKRLVHTRTALGVIPCGSGNGFARHLGIPVDTKGALEFINRAEILSVDYGKINGSPFFCSCGVGFDALVSNDFANSTHRGLASYVQKAFVDWVKFEPEAYEVVVGSMRRRFKAFVIACGNASQYGNNAYIAPYASMRDGMLSISVLEPFTAVEVPYIVAQLFSNQLDKNSRVTTFSANKLIIKRKGPGLVHYDGEPSVMDAELKIEVVPEGLNVLAAPGWDGTCEPLPLHRQFFDVITGVVSIPEIPLQIFK